LGNSLLNYVVDVGRKTDPQLWNQSTDADFDSGIFNQTIREGVGSEAIVEIAQYTIPLTFHNYVTNISNVDQSDDIGGHSSFPSQQQGPDSITDALTEQTRLYEQIVVTSEISTSNTEWIDVSGATVSFTPRSLSEEWMVFVTADIRSNQLTENQARFRYIINDVPRGETGVQQGTTGATPINPYNSYFHFSKIAGVTAQQTVTFQFQASSGATAYARNVHLLCIRLDWAGLEYAEINGDTLITGNQTVVSLQFTPITAGDYIVAYCALLSEIPIDAGVETWLDYDSGTYSYPDPWSTPNTRRIHTDRDQFEPHGVLSRVNLNTSLHTFNVKAQLRTEGDTSTARDVRIVAFRVDSFALFEFDEDPTISSTMSGNVVRSVVNTATPGEQCDYLVLAGIHTIANGTSSREAGGIEIDDVFVQRKGDQRLDYAEIARIASITAVVESTSSSFKVETIYGTGGTGSDTVYSKQSTIYVLKLPKQYELDLEVQFSNVPIDFQDESLCIYTGTLGSEELLLDYWNGTNWINLDTNLNANTWNNYTVSVDSSYYTIRFSDNNATNDSIQDTWEIDVVLLTLHDDNYPTYYATGTYTSQKKDTGGQSFFDQLSWSGILPNMTNLQLRIRTASTEEGLVTADWYGPTNTSDYYTESSGVSINTIHNNDRWIQYQVYFSTSDPILVAPQLRDVSIIYRSYEYYPCFSGDVGVLFYNVPVNKYHLENNYYEPINPLNVESLVTAGTSATVTNVFAVQKNPISGEEEYIRIVVAPLIRYITSNISSPQQTTHYLKMYLTNLVLGESPRISQSVTLMSDSLQVYRQSNIESVRVTVSFPQGSSGFDNSFFHFPTITEDLFVPEGSELELFMSEVEVNIGI
jgi:hypothetical protein